ncbi:transposase [Streptomyces sp. NPDC055722]
MSPAPRPSDTCPTSSRRARSTWNSATAPPAVPNTSTVSRSELQAAALPDGRHVTLPRLGTILRRLSRRVCRRRGPDGPTGQQPSKRWRKANEQRNRLHYRVANLRADALHKLTTKVTDVYGIVVVEDLNVVGMLRNRRPARQIAEAGFGEIRRQLTCKSGRDACRIVVADRWFPALPASVWVSRCELGVAPTAGRG